MSKVALLLGGGAPNSTLMTGCLLAFDEAGVKFDVYSASGAGGAMALMYLCPKGMSRQDMMRNSVNMSVSDAIFKFLPVNYKVFQKESFISGAYRKMLSALPGYDLVMNQYGMSRSTKFASDLLQLWWAATTPTTLNYFSSGCCAHEPFLHDLIDFGAIEHLKEELYLNSYCVEDRRMVIFGKDTINQQTLAASLGYPFFYKSVKMRGKTYMEGCAVDAFNVQGLFEHDKDIRSIVVLNAFGNEGYIQAPSNLWDAYVQSYVLPLAELCRKDLKLLRHWYLPQWNEHHPDNQAEMITIDFKVPAEWLPTAMDWSESNMQRMFDLGYETGKKYVEHHGPHLGRTIF
jgi:predicted acylesterase/phospholipase RssA